jgi:hypothetical protein
MLQSQMLLLSQQWGLAEQWVPLVLLQPVRLSSRPNPTTRTFTQASASATWTINHGLAAFPSVTLTDPLGNVIVGQIQYVNSGQIVVAFSQPVAGLAYLNV